MSNADPTPTWLRAIFEARKNDPRVNARLVQEMGEPEKDQETGQWLVSSPRLPGEVFRDIDGEKAQAAAIARLREPVWIVSVNMNGSGTGVMFHEGQSVFGERQDVVPAPSGFFGSGVGSTREEAARNAKAMFLRDIADRVTDGEYAELERVGLAFPDFGHGLGYTYGVASPSAKAEALRGLADEIDAGQHGALRRIVFTWTP